jgi:hypothetical protein
MALTPPPLPRARAVHCWVQDSWEPEEHVSQALVEDFQARRPELFKRKKKGKKRAQKQQGGDGGSGNGNGSSGAGGGGGAAAASGNGSGSGAAEQLAASPAAQEALAAARV